MGCLELGALHDVMVLSTIARDLTSPSAAFQHRASAAHLTCSCTQMKSPMSAVFVVLQQILLPPDCGGSGLLPQAQCGSPGPQAGKLLAHHRQTHAVREPECCICIWRLVCVVSRRPKFCSYTTHDLSPATTQHRAHHLQ